MKSQQPRRSAGEGPWIALDDMRAFKQFLTDNGFQWREHPGLNSTGYQVRHQGHWMALLWNKGFKRFTADRRLSLIVQSFATEKPKDQRVPELPKGPMVKCVHCGNLFEQYFEGEDMCVDCDD